MLRLALSVAACQFLVTSGQEDPLGCRDITDTDACKSLKGCKWHKPTDTCFNKELGPGTTDYPTPEPTRFPTRARTSSPTPNPSPAPTSSPTPVPTGNPTPSPSPAPTEPPSTASGGSGPEPTVCSTIASKSQCNRTPTCVYQNNAEVCAGCTDIESKNTCTGVDGCAWKQKACMLEDSHPNDDMCLVNESRRLCKRMEGCQWMRSGECRGHSGCASKRNNIDCRAAHECFWKPREAECIDIGEVP